VDDGGGDGLAGALCDPRLWLPNLMAAWLACCLAGLLAAWASRCAEARRRASCRAGLYAGSAGMADLPSGPGEEALFTLKGAANRWAAGAVGGVQAAAAARGPGICCCHSKPRPPPHTHTRLWPAGPAAT
jgi:hypothetical protein